MNSHARKLTRRLNLVLPLAIVLAALAACGGSKSSSQMQWIEGTVPPAARVLDTPTTAPDKATSADAPTSIPPTATSLASPPVSGDAVKLTAEQLKQYKPDELGLIPVLEYHILTTDDSDNQQFVRPISKFKQDLQWLYDHNFYVISLHDLINNTISAPAGKHPFAMTFDDSTTGQFRFLVGANGSVSVDPNSGVGILEDFFAKHPDFGHTAFFAVIATDSFCFDWQGTETDADQEKYCGQKITWLLDHGYEIGNHTVDHVNLQDVPDDKFVAELGGDFDWAKSKDPRALPDILAMPFGMYPDLDKHKQQRTWLRDGFSYNGQNYKINGVLEVGANPSVAPDSTDWDPVWIPRIQAFDADAKVQGGGGFDTWFPDFESRPETLYTSDGNPNTITVPNTLPIDIDGTLDANKIAAEGKELIRYDG